MNAAIHTENLSKRYRNSDALSGLNLAVPAGSIYALVGPNGAGKTTIIKLLMNIMRASEGRAQVLGLDTARLNGKDFNRIGYVSENQEMPEWMTVGYFLDYMRHFYPQWDRALEQQLVRQFDLPLGRKLKHLSRGMRMKAAFASVLAYRPALIVLDEPFSGLDPLVRDELIEGLLERAAETTIFLSSHDLAEIESFASHVGYIEQGRMQFSEEMAILTDRFREITITLPEPAALPSSIPPSWLQVETAGSVIRFVESGYRGEATERDLAAVFPQARDIACNPMPLRSIFLAVARSKRATNRSASSEKTA